ncbi:hypothetical protein DPMN_140314 [Dreissena polymorpha]|uniref:Secreted protein n=1 Tax=Dreissena polymorpha TaxID=45954 RepID=A0A9D4JLM1_DREPO|nr:hypothetical protein DPMN_140314 [Dreissena polymorpha]
MCRVFATISCFCLFSDTSSVCSSGIQKSGGDGWQPPPSRWIPNPPQAASIWHNQDDRYMQQYVQQQRMPAFQLTSPTQPTLQQYRCRPPLTQVSCGNL